MNSLDSKPMQAISEKLAKSHNDSQTTETELLELIKLRTFTDTEPCAMFDTKKINDFIPKGVVEKGISGLKPLGTYAGAEIVEDTDDPAEVEDCCYLLTPEEMRLCLDEEFIGPKPKVCKLLSPEVMRRCLEKLDNLKPKYNIENFRSCLGKFNNPKPTNMEGTSNLDSFDTNNAMKIVEDADASVKGCSYPLAEVIRTNTISEIYNQFLENKLLDPTTKIFMAENTLKSKIIDIEIPNKNSLG
jgi:hypothetical protein